MNNFNGIGRITADPELRYNQSGKGICKFSLAINRDKETTDFIRCVSFGKTAELIAEYIRKGDQIGITGSIWTGSYTKEDGTKVYTTEVCVNRLHFISGGNSEKGNSRQSNAKEDENLEDFPFEF